MDRRDASRGSRSVVLVSPAPQPARGRAATGEQPSQRPELAPPESQRTLCDVQLLALDLDGTLLDDAKQVSRCTTAALRQVRERGIKVVIASARPPRTVRDIYHSLSLDTWQINYNGAMIWDEPGQRCVYHLPMPGPLVRQIIQHARDYRDQVLVTCEIRDRWYTDRLDQTYTTETGRLFKPDVIASIDAFCSRPVTKLLLLGNPRLILKLEAILHRAFFGQVSIIRADPELIQIMHLEASKSAALRLVARHYRVPMERVMAIGDAPNDVDMLEAAGIAVAVENAHPMVKRAADWVAPSNNSHGVFQALKRYGLCE